MKKIQILSICIPLLLSLTFTIISSSVSTCSSTDFNPLVVVSVTIKIKNTKVLNNQ